jgi:hypothetical protein
MNHLKTTFFKKLGFENKTKKLPFEIAGNVVLF